MGMAIMKGIGLGETLGGLQNAIGDFLEGDGWKGFVNGLKDGAAAAKEIVVALSNQGGFTASLQGVAEIIIAAFMDGAVGAYNMMKEKLGKMDKYGILGFAGGLVKAPFVAAASLGSTLGRASAGDFSEGKPVNGVSPDNNKSFLASALEKIKGVAEINNLGKSAGKVKDAWDRHYERMVELDKTLKGVKEAKQKVISKQASDMWEAQYTKDKAGREKAKQDAAEAAQAKADMLFQEFLDPSKRTSRLDEEKRKSDAEAQLQREYADIQRREATTFGLRNPNDRDKQVMELMNARQEVTRSQDEIQRQIEKNTRSLADTFERLLQMKG
jgi:hypothetical protein